MPIPLPTQRTYEQKHNLEWNDRLQDSLDGVADPSFEAHLSGCALCQTHLAEMERLDQALSVAMPRLELDSSFDRQIFAQIVSMDESRRIAARQRIERELQENLAALSHGWRRTLAFVAPGVLGGIAITFALAAWLDESGLARTLAAENLQALGGLTAEQIRGCLTALLGAGVGLAVACWLTTVVD